MRWIASLALFLVLTGVARAAASDDQYLDIYNEVMQADSLQKDGQLPAAATKYLEAQTRLKRLKEIDPTWNPDVITFRLQYVTEKLQALGNVLPSATVAPAAPVAAVPASHPEAALEQQVAGLQEQVRTLTAANGEMANKLKEALSVQPAAVSPVELTKREEEIVALKKEKDLLTVALDQAKAAGAAAQAASSAKLATDLATAQHDASEANKKLEAATSELAALKTAQANQPPPADIARITQERDKLKEELAGAASAQAASSAKFATDLAAAQHDVSEANKKLDAATSELAALKTAQANQPAPVDIAQITQERDKLKEELAGRTKDLADAEAHGDRDVLAAHAQLKEVQEQRDELQKKLDAVSAASSTTTSGGAAEIEQLHARLAALEAKAVPYTPEELAMLNQAQSSPPTQLPVAGASPAERPHVVHSLKDLPPGAGALMADAMRASMERDFAQAEAKYQDILRQDENNVYVLAHLANAQFAEGHLDDCERTVERALALDPEDPASLYLLGVLRYRQERLDDALDALSRSAKYNSTNAGTENYLGCVLADKGMRPAAETALRKALELEPDYPDAHYNLAFIYATGKPPSPALARLHYKRALDLGHARSPSLEKLLDGEK